MRYVIVGGGAAGMAALETLRRLDGDGQITMVSDEERTGYYRPLIPHLIHDGFAEERFRRSPDPASAPGVRVMSGVKALSISPRDRTVITPGEQVPYDRLLLATGGHAVAPAVKGLALEDVLTLRTYDDGVKLAQAARRVRRVLVIGGGRIGILAALALNDAGMEVSVVEMLGHVLPLQLDAAAAAIIAEAIEARGIRLIAGRQVKEIARGSSGARLAVLDDGRDLSFDVLVAAIGVSPNLDLARQMGAATERGVLVDEALQTTVPDVYAAGDLVQLVDLATGTGFVSGGWTNAVDMGHCAASNMAGVPRKYAGGFFVQNAVVIAGIPTVAVGAVHAGEPEFEVHARRQGNAYRKVAFKGNRLAGVLLVGAVDRAGVYRSLIRDGRDVGRHKDRIVAGTLTYASFLGKERIR